MRHVPEPDDDGVRRYGHFHKSPEDKTRCAVQVFGFHSSHQCENPRKPGSERCGVHAEAPKARIKMWYVGFANHGARERGGISTVQVARVSGTRVQLPKGAWDKLVSRSGRYFATEAEAVAHVRDGLVRDRDYHARAIVEADKKLRALDKLYPRAK